MAASNAALMGSGEAINKAIEVSDEAIQKTIPLNQKVLCETVHKGEKTLYYCQKVNDAEYLRIKESHEDKTILGDVLIFFLIIVALLLVWFLVSELIKGFN